MRRQTMALLLAGALVWVGAAQAQTAPQSASASSSASASAALPSLDLASGYVVPFRYNPPTMPFLVVQARVNGQGPYPFMVDTGLSSAVIIAKDFVPLLKLRSTGEQARLNETVKTQGVAVKTLVIETDKPGVPFTVNLLGGAATAFVMDFAFMRDIYAGPPIAGVIGAPVLATMTERIDFAHHEMTFYTKPHAPLQLPSSACLPLQQQEQPLLRGHRGRRRRKHIPARGYRRAAHHAAALLSSASTPNGNNHSWTCYGGQLHSGEPLAVACPARGNAV